MSGNNQAPVVIENNPDFFKKVWNATTTWLATQGGLAQDVRQFDGPTLIAAFHNACRARGLADGEPDMDNVDPELLQVIDRLVAARLKHHNLPTAQRALAIGAKGAKQQDTDMAKIDKEITNLVKGLTRGQAVGAYFVFTLSQALEVVPAAFSADKSLVVRSLPLAFSNMTAGFGQLFHKGATLAQFASILLPQRVLTGLPGRVDVLAAVIDKKFGMNLAEYLPSNLVPTAILMMIFYGYPLGSALSRNHNLDKAVDFFESASALATIDTDMNQVASDLAAADKLLNEVLEKSKVGKVSQAAFGRVVKAIRDGQQSFDLPKALGIKVEERRMSYVKRAWRVILGLAKKGAIGANWLAVIGGLMVATIGSDQQLTVQSLVVLGALVQIITYLVNTNASVTTLMRLFILAAGPSMAQYSTVAFPLAFYRKSLTEYIDGKTIFDRSELARWGAAVLGLAQLWTIIPLVPQLLAAFIRIFGRCFPSTAPPTVAAGDVGTSEPDEMDREIEDAVVDLFGDMTAANIEGQAPVDYANVEPGSWLFELGNLETDRGPVGYDDAVDWLSNAALAHDLAAKRIETAEENDEVIDALSEELKAKWETIRNEAEARMRNIEYRRTIHKLTQDNLERAGVPSEGIDSIMAYFTEGKGEMAKTVEDIDFDTKQLREDPRLAGADLSALVYKAECAVVVFKQVSIQYWRFTNSALSHIGLPTTTWVVEVFHSTTSEAFGAYVQDGWVDDYHGMLHQGLYDALSERLTHPKQIHEASAGYWERRDHRTKDVKVVRMMPQKLSMKDPRYSLPEDKVPSNFDHRHSALFGAYFTDDPQSHGLGGVKCLTSQPLNPNRQVSMIHVFELFSGRLKGVVAGSQVSSLRTIEMWNEARALVQPEEGWVGYNVGAGPIGKKWPETIAAASELSKPSRLIVQSTGKSAFGIAEAWNARENKAFGMTAVEPLVEGQGRANKASLKGVKIVSAVTANPTETPIFKEEDIDWTMKPVLIDLSIKMFEGQIMQKFIDNGWPIVFDDFDNSMHRNVQSATIFLTARKLLTLKDVKKYNIHNLADVKRKKMVFKGTPLMLVSSGCASFDVHQGNAILEKCNAYRTAVASEEQGKIQAR